MYALALQKFEDAASNKKKVKHSEVLIQTSVAFAK